MLDNCIYNILDYILPNTGKSKHDILRLEYLSACNIMQNEKDILRILPLIPPRLYKPLLQSLIHNSYLKFINSLDISRPNYYYSFDKMEIPFPETLSIMILNWPYEELILRNLIPSLEPPVDLYPCDFNGIPIKYAICQVDDMLNVFNIFCKRLIQFITEAVFKCTLTNKQEMACNLRRLDVTGLLNVDHCRYAALLSDDILKQITTSTIDTLGRKIEIFADAGPVDILAEGFKFELLRNIIELSMKPDVGISLYFKTITTEFSYFSDYLPNDLYSNLLAPGRCEYIQLSGFNMDQSFVENLSLYLPGLVGISLQRPKHIKNLEFLSSFQYLEQLCIKNCTHNGVTNDICNMSNGLKYLSLKNCSLERQHYEDLAKSNHAETLLQLDIHSNKITNDSEAVGLITLCQNLKNVKVLCVENCSLETLSSNTVYKLIDAFKYCDQLEFLSLKANSFSLEITTLIIDCLAQKKSLRYLSLYLPETPRNGRRNDEDYEEDDEDVDDENMEYQQNLCKTFHEKINKFRHSPIYISWCEY